MSFHHLAKTVKTTQVSGLHKLALIILADLVNEKNGGGAWPSHQFMADQLGCSRRHAIRIINDLANQGFIRVVKKGGKGGTNRYYIALELVTPMSPLVTPMSPPDVTFTTSASDTHVTQYYKTHIATYKPTAPRPAAAAAVGALEQIKTPDPDEWEYVPAPRCRHNTELPYYKCQDCITELAKEGNNE